MLIVGEGVGWRLGFHSGGWWWTAGFVALYAAPAVFAFIWLGTTISTHVLVLSLVLAAALIVLSETDRRAFRLPDVITIPLGLSGILATTITDGGIAWHVFSAGLGLVLILLVDQAYRTWRGFSGIGLGDAKLFAASGAWLGAEALPTVLLWTFVAALIVLALMHAAVRQICLQTPTPCGAFLAFGTWLVSCLGPLH